MTKKKGVVESAVEAAEELGQAAGAFKESWKHIKKAQSKGHPAARAVARTGKKAWSTTKNAAVRLMPGTKRRGRK